MNIFFSVSQQKYKQIRKLPKFSARETLLQVLAYIFNFANIKVSLQIEALFAL